MMQKMLNEYNKECVVKSKLANFIWKAGWIATFVLRWSGAIQRNNINYLYFYFIDLLMLLIISNIIFIKKAAKKFQIKIKVKHFLRLNEIWNIYDKIDIYQKQWIMNYCSKNKWKTTNKLRMLIEEVRNTRNINTIKYINPIIIGTLLIPIWEIGIQKLIKLVGFIEMIPSAIFFAVVLSIMSGWLCKKIMEYNRVIKCFDRYADEERLEELLVYAALKCKK